MCEKLRKKLESVFDRSLNAIGLQRRQSQPVRLTRIIIVRGRTLDDRPWMPHYRPHPASQRAPTLVLREPWWLSRP